MGETMLFHILPTHMIHDSPRFTVYIEADTEEAPQDSLDVLKEERELTLFCSAKYQHDLHR